MPNPLKALLRSIHGAATVLALVDAASAAQLLGGEWEVRHRLDGRNNREGHGFAVACAGDVDADGIADWVTGAPGSPGGARAPGRAVVFSGRTGLPIHWWEGTQRNEAFGHAVAGAGDLDGDGHADLLIGSPSKSVAGMIQAGRARAFSGRTGGLLYEWSGTTLGARLGMSLAGAGDVNRDGVPDVILGAPSEDASGFWNAGAAYVYSGATGLLLHRFAGDDSDQELGLRVDSAGDLDLDGHADLFVSKPLANGSNGFAQGTVLVYSGATGAEIRRFEGSLPFEELGLQIARLGDLDGDGLPELAIASLWLRNCVTVYSGATSQVMHLLCGEYGFGQSISPTGDVDGDGVPDLLIGRDYASPGGRTKAGTVDFYSGDSGALLHRVEGEFAGDQLGYAAAGQDSPAPDTTVALGAWGADPNSVSGAGSVFIHHFHPFLNASAHELSASVGGDVRLDLQFPLDLAGGPYALLASRSGTGPTDLGPVAVPLTRDGLFERSLAGRLPTILRGSRGLLGPDAEARAGVLVQPGQIPPSAAGTTLFLAAVAQDPAAARTLTSIAVQILVLP